MKRLNYVSLIALWSSMLCSNLSFASGDTFVKVDNVKGFSTEANSEILVKNMPRQRSQQNFPICFGEAPSCLLQKHLCKVKQISDCANPPADLEISPFSVLGYATKNTVICEQKNGKNFDPYGLEVDSEQCGESDLPDSIKSSYANIAFHGSPAIVLGNAAATFSFKSEACYPSDKIINKYGTTSEGIEKFVSKMRSIYNRGKSNTEACESCLVSEVNNLLETDQVDSINLKKAFDRKTFQEFLYKIVYRDCAPISSFDKPVPNRFPSILPGKKEIAPTSISEVVDKTKLLLSAGNPVMVNELCVFRPPDGSCPNKHAVVISGYKKVCGAGKCVNAFKVQNSWGEDWQKEFNGGWVDADTLIANTANQPLKAGVISWLE